MRYKTLPARAARPHFRYKTLPARPISKHIRYKTLPAHPKWPNLAQSTHAGRVLYRFHHQEAEQGEFCTEHEAELGLATTPQLAPQVRKEPEQPQDRDAAPAGGGRASMGWQGQHGLAGPAWVGRASMGWQGHLQPNFACNSPRHEPTQAQKPQNINDQISILEILSGELHAKLLIDSQD